jgi:hypothetical protein
MPFWVLLKCDAMRAFAALRFRQLDRWQHGHKMAGDEILKYAFANFALKNLEMAPTSLADRGGGLWIRRCDPPIK